MTTKATKTPAVSKANTLKAPDVPGMSREAKLAYLAAAPCHTAAAVSTAFSAFGEVDLTETVGVLRESAERVHGGDLREVETTLVAQAAALNSAFTLLARRAALNMGEHIGAVETYMRLALRAQNQCRMTLETLATIKNPPVVFAKQANIAHGPQQVNNEAGHVARVEEIKKPPTELLEHDHGQWLDSGTKAAASGSDQAVEAVATIHRPAHESRQSRRQP